MTMRILMINKFLYPNGGSETYVLKLGEYLQREGHEVQYFGMDHEGRCVGNRVNAYTTDMDFHSGSKLSKLTYPIKTIYSSEARKKIRLVLDDFQPDVCHINNFNFQLSPSIILEIVKWRKQAGKECKIVYTAHDSQLVCPNHMLRNPNTQTNCEKCLDGHFSHCIHEKCIHGSTAKSIIGTMEACFWRAVGVYRHIDTVICCSDFMKKELSANPQLKGKLITLHNFIDEPAEKTSDVVKGDYVLYFGRYSEEKGIKTLMEVCRMLSEVKFIFAGKGPLENEINSIDNIENVGFKKGDELNTLIRNALFSVYPSEWYEYCPFSILDSMALGTPVLGADIGGIPELIDDKVNGELFISGDASDLICHISELWANHDLISDYRRKCSTSSYDSIKEYADKLITLYNEKM